jgi:flagellar protein FlaJ
MKMEKQLVKTEKQLDRSRTGPTGLVGSLVGKLTGLTQGSADKKKDKEYLDLDLFSQMTYMAAISSSGLARNRIFESAAHLPYSSSCYFKEVNFLVHKLNYDYPEACRIVGEKTQEPEPRAILLRLAGTLSSGEPEHVFLAREAFVQGETYGNSYERNLQSLKTWTDAYVSLTLSASLIIIVAVIAMMIYPVQTTFVILLAGLSILATVAGAWIIHRAAPKEIKTHSLPERSRGQTVAQGLLKLLLPAGIIICSILALLKIDVGWILLAASAFVLPPGLIIMWDDRKIEKHDNDIAGFIRSLGGVAKAVGTTISDAIGKLDIRSTVSLQGPIRRLNARLHTAINNDLCWQKFVGETGSELVNRSVKTFRDAVEMGADPGTAADQTSLYAMKMALLRARRKLVSSGFTWLTMVMHAVTCGLMLFICGILLVFSGAIKGMGSLEAGDYGRVLPSFGFFGDSTQMELFHTLVVIVILVFTGANAFAIRAAGGGHQYKFLFYFGILAAISGATFLLAPHLVAMALGTMAPIM